MRAVLRAEGAFWSGVVCLLTRLAPQLSGINTQRRGERKKRGDPYHNFSRRPNAEIRVKIGHRENEQKQKKRCFCVMQTTRLIAILRGIR